LPAIFEIKHDDLARQPEAFEQQGDINEKAVTFIDFSQSDRVKFGLITIHR
jgi:hypothetical protein